MTMKRIIILIAGLFICAGLGAQNVPQTRSPLDSAILGKDIMGIMGPGVSVNQSVEVRQALLKYVAQNAEKQIPGYRIRVFLDNSPQARGRSESITASLKALYPQHQVYRSFESPNYKVLIGDFRSKDEALGLFNALKGSYPTAYIIKDVINYPL